MIRLRDRRRIRATAADGATSILPISKDITLQWGPFAARNSVHGRAVHGNDSHLHSKSEPVDGKGNGGYPYNWSPKMEATTATLGMNNESRNVSLELVLAEADSGNTVRLRGPSIRIPDRLWNECLSEPKTPGLFASLNPFVRNGLWRMLARAARHQECIRERRCAKRDFAAK